MNFTDNFEKYSFPNLGYVKIPKLSIPKEDVERLNLKDNSSSEEYLLALVKAGLQDKIKSGKIDKKDFNLYKERAKSEYDEMIRLNFGDYILLIYHIIKFCKNNNILNGFSRGSCGGSVLLYLIGCIKIDAIKHNLLFERFISSARTEVKEINGQMLIKSNMLADFDLDSQQSEKSRVNDWFDENFPNRTAAICNISTFQSKALLKEVYKVLENASEEDAKEVSKLIDSKFGKVQSLTEALAENAQFKQWATKHEEVIKICLKLYELNKNKSVHASGIMLCNDRIDECLPLELDSDKNIVSGYTMDDAQLFGVKFDNLGLKNLNIVSECLELVNKEMEDIDVNDKTIYEFLNRSSDYYGVFQAEEGLGKSVLQKIKPQNIEDLGLSIATGRPGSMSFIDDIVKAKGQGKYKDWGDERISNILKDSYSVIVYQESIMRLSKEMALFEPLEVNEIRKIIGKKLTDKMPAWKEKFINQSIANGYKKEVCEEVWKTFEMSGNYLFNKSHAIGYSYLTALCVFLKANHPTQFFYSSLKNCKHEQKPQEEITKIAQELSNFNIRLLPPHITKSNFDYSIEGKDIRMGLGAIKGIAEANIEKLNKFKTEFSNKFQIFQASIEAKLPAGIISSLILVGSFDNDKLNISRPKLLLEYQLYKILSVEERKKVLEYAEKYNFDLVNTVRALNKEIKNEKGKPVIKDSRLETIRKKYQSFKEIYEFNTKNEELTNFIMESRLIGFSYTSSLHRIYKKHIGDLLDIHTCLAEDDGQYITTIGEVAEVKQGKSKEKKTPWFKVYLKDHAAQITCMAFTTDRFDNIAEIEDNNGRLPKEGDYVIIKGQKKGADTIFIKSLTIQKIEILQRISDLDKIKEKE